MADQGQTDPSNNRCSATREGTSGDVVIEIGHTMAEQNDDQPTAEAIELRQRAVHSSKGTTSSSDGSNATEQAPWYQNLNPIRVLSTIRTRLRRRPFDDRDSVPKQERIDDYPQGYPRLAALLNSDPNFPVYRRFGTLHHRVILHRQQELTKLERRLNELDKKDANDHPHRLQSLQWDHDDGVALNQESSEREQLIDEIDERLKHYDDLLHREREMSSMLRPSKRNYNTVLNYIWNKRSMERSEAEYIELQSDFVILAEEQDSEFHGNVENILAMIGSKTLEKLFSTPEQRQMTNDSSIQLYSRARINIVVQTTVTIVATVIFTVPLSLLTALNISNQQRLALIAISVVLFPLIIRPFSRPQTHELLAMTAGYAAVLVVFVGGFQRR